MTTASKSTTVDAAAQASIGAAARELHLPTVRTESGRLAEIAARERHTHLRYLAEVLAAEVDDRTERRRARRINDAKFPRLKRLAEFNIDAVPGIAPATVGHLAAGHYMDAGEPVVLLGDSGTGKSHLLIGLGLAACEQGRRVRYVTTAQLVNELVEAADERVLSRVVARYGRLDLLCLDELGYVQIDPRGAELLFQIITEREERASVAIATNLPFSEWGTVFPDPRLVAAIVDRVTFNAHIIETGTKSYRLRTSKTTTRTKPGHLNQVGPKSMTIVGPNHLTKRRRVGQTVNVLDKLSAWLGRFIGVLEAKDLHVLALWILHTYLAAETYTTPRLLLDSTMPSSGKTTVLDHLGHLCQRPVQAATLSSPALIPRMLDASGVRTIRTRRG